MKNEMIAKVLKEYRKQNALSVKDVISKLEDHSVIVAEKTLYGWENGQSQPDADTLMLLCEIYHIDNILETFGYTTETPPRFSQFEIQVIQKLREHPEMLDAIKKLLDL